MLKPNKLSGRKVVFSKIKEKIGAKYPEDYQKLCEKLQKIQNFHQNVMERIRESVKN